jgi:hypothetical protein
MGRQHPPRRFLRPRQFQNQIADFAFENGFRMRVVGDNRLGRRTRGKQLFLDERNNLAFLTALAGNGQQIEDQLLGFRQVGFMQQGRGGGRGFFGHVDGMRQVKGGRGSRRAAAALCVN